MWNILQGSGVMQLCSPTALLRLNKHNHTRSGTCIMWETEREGEIPLLLLHLIQVTSLLSIHSLSHKHTTCTLSHSLSPSHPLTHTHTLTLAHHAECWISLAACLFLRMFGATTLKEYTISAFDTTPPEGLHADTSDE